METERVCPSCGCRLPTDVSHGMCPTCLMKAGFETGSVPSPGEPAGNEPFRPPSVEELAKLFPPLQVVELLGQGGMGAVYKARQPELDRWVALKVLPAQATAKPGFMERFNREARALAWLNHPGIVGVHEFGQVGGMPYFIMEFVDGVTLRQLVQARPLSTAEALKLVPQICEALQYAHEEGVVHRDIKPENILIDKKGRVKIADFGIAKTLARNGENAHLTLDQQVIGTPHYMAPEQIEHPQEVDHRADIYSLGVVFYELLTGELPLGKFGPPSSCGGGVQIDVRLDKVVLRALEKKPERRYQHAVEVKTDVDTIVHTPPVSADQEKRKQWARAWRWGLGLGLPAVVIAGLLWFWTPGKKQPAAKPTLSSEAIVFPADAGVIDVTKPPYNVKADGRTDATAAIQKALSEYAAKNAIIYLPHGTYLVSDTLRWGEGSRRTTLQGQSREGTIIQLKDSCAGFTGPNLPKAVIWTGPKGEDRFRNSVRNLTLDTGRNNPGAIGVQFTANIVGGLREVLIRSGDGQGSIGLDMGYVDMVGPLFIKNLTVQGFDVGIRSKDSLHSQTFEHLTLTGQNKVGFLNEGQTVSIRDLTSTGQVPVVRNASKVGLVVIVDAKLSGTGAAAGHAALINCPGMFVRNVTVAGFAHAILHNGENPTNVPGPLVKEWSSNPFPNSGPSLVLPVKETPEVPWGDLADWVNAVSFGANPDGGGGDDSDAIQRAIDSGKGTVYLPRGEYTLRRPIELRGKVRRLIGCEAVINVSLPEGKQTLLTVGQGDAPVVMVERLTLNFGPSPSEHRFIDNRSARTLVLRDCSGGESEFTGPGEIFLESVGGRMVFHGQKVWARQFHQATRFQMPRERWCHLRNDGGQLWILGESTAGPGPIVTTTGGGQTEVLGGLIYANAAALEQPLPAFIVEEGALSVSVNEANHGHLSYPVLVQRVTKGSRLDLLTPGQAKGGINASLIPLFGTR